MHVSRYGIDNHWCSRHAKRIATRAGVFSVHHIAPELFGGFEETIAGVKLASAEKALFDPAYLSGGRSRLFTAVPELEIGKTFRWRELRRWVSRVPSRRARTLVEERIERFAGRRDRTAAPCR
jgi:hypothetical protein